MMKRQMLMTQLMTRLLKQQYTLCQSVLRTCYSTSQQEALKEAFEHAYGQNRHIFVKLEAEPSNIVDSHAIAVFIKLSVDYKKVTICASITQKTIA